MGPKAYAVAVFLGALGGVIGAQHETVSLFVLNGLGGCWPWSPKDVPYHEGMTLCPGQTAHLDIIVPLPPIMMPMHRGESI